MIKNRFIIILAIIAIMSLTYGCNIEGRLSTADKNIKAKGANNMKTLTIKWQRLVDKKGQTCDRCGSTGKEVQRAFHKLEKSLEPLGIKVTLEKKALDPATCAKDVSQSNRIWIGGRSLEELLGATSGKSLCGFCCAELDEKVECRTVEVGGQVYETIPAELIVKAGLQAASQAIETLPEKPCCSKKPAAKKPKRGCDTKKYDCNKK
jgi:hypothetical protein